MSSNTDLLLLEEIEYYYVYFINLIYVAKIILTGVVIYLISYHSPESMKSYRVYLLTNMISTFLFGFSLYLFMPVVTSPTLIVCSIGLIRYTNGSVVRWFVILGPLIYITHLGGIFLCLLFQYAHLQMSKIRTMFYDHKKPFLIYLLSCIVMGIPVVYPIAASSANTSPTVDMLLFDNKVDYYLAEQYLVKHHACFQIDVFHNNMIISLGISMVVIGSFLVVNFSYMHFRLFKEIIWSNYNMTINDKTILMQRVLYKSILAQTICLVLFYFIPVFFIVGIVLFGASLASTLIFLGLIPIYLYELCNLVLTLIYIGAFRQYLVLKLSTVFRITKKGKTPAITTISRQTPALWKTSRK